MIAATLTLEDATRSVWEAVVVGAGPAGSLAARELARRGRSVLLVDRAAFPRRKVCGCCLNGNALATLRQVGLGDLPARCGAVPLRQMQLAAGSYLARVPLTEGVALSREAFDAALVLAAIEAGAAFLPETIASASGRCKPPDLRSSQGVYTPRSPDLFVKLLQHDGGREIRARVALAADGLGGGFLSQALAAQEARIGVGAVSADAPAFYRPGTIYMVCGATGYLGLVRLEDGRLDLAAALDVTRMRAGGGPGAAAVQLLAAVGWPQPNDLVQQSWRGTAALTRSAAVTASERVFVLGDAAGYVEPFTGEGMAWALAAAEAVAPIAARGWQPSSVREWERAYRQVVRDRQLTCRFAAAVLRRPWLTRTAIALLSQMPHLARPIVYHLNTRTTRPAPHPCPFPLGGKGQG